MGSNESTQTPPTSTATTERRAPVPTGTARPRRPSSAWDSTIGRGRESRTSPTLQTTSGPPTRQAQSQALHRGGQRPQGRVSVFEPTRRRRVNQMSPSTLRAMLGGGRQRPQEIAPTITSTRGSPVETDIHSEHQQLKDHLEVEVPEASESCASSVKVRGLPADVDHRIIEAHFLSKKNGGCGDVEDITYPLHDSCSTTAKITFESGTTARNICSQQRALSGVPLKLEVVPPDQHSNRDTPIPHSSATVVRNLPAETMSNYVRAYFMSKKNGGCGDVNDVVFPFHETCHTSAQVTFSEKHTAERMGGREHVMGGVPLTLEVVPAENQASRPSESESVPLAPRPAIIATPTAHQQMETSGATRQQSPSASTTAGSYFSSTSFLYRAPKRAEARAESSPVSQRFNRNQEVSGTSPRAPTTAGVPSRNIHSRSQTTTSVWVESLMARNRFRGPPQGTNDVPRRAVGGAASSRGKAQSNVTSPEANKSPSNETPRVQSKSGVSVDKTPGLRGALASQQGSERLSSENDVASRSNPDRAVDTSAQKPMRPGSRLLNMPAGRFDDTLRGKAGRVPLERAERFSGSTKKPSGRLRGNTRKPSAAMNGVLEDPIREQLGSEEKRQLEIDVADISVIQLEENAPQLTEYDETILSTNNAWLSDSIIDTVQFFLKRQFSQTDGLAKVLEVMFGGSDPIKGKGKVIQIHDASQHWITSTVEAGIVLIYDSLPRPLDEMIQNQLRRMYAYIAKDLDHIKVRRIIPQLQSTNSECGLFALAYATSLAFGEEASKIDFQQHELRSHLRMCLKDGKMTVFPRWDKEVSRMFLDESLELKVTS